MLQSFNGAVSVLFSSSQPWLNERQVFDSTGATVEAGYSYDAYGVMLGERKPGIIPLELPCLHAGEILDNIS